MNEYLFKLLQKFLIFLKIGKNCNYVELIFISSKLCFLLEIIKKHTLLRYQFLYDLTAVDFPLRSKRFQILYLLMSLKSSSRLLLKTEVAESIDSATSVFSSAGWLEREAWDLFGIIFFNTSDLRRILTDYGFLGFPLRKSFPVSGYTEVFYSDALRQVVTESLEVEQEFRDFRFETPWNIKI